MKSINQFFLGVTSYSKVLPFVKEHKMWSFFLFPLGLNLVLFGLLVYLVILFSVSLHQFFLVSAIGFGFTEGTWVFVLLTWLFSYGAKLFMFYLVWQFYQLLSLIFLAPLFSYLSEQVQEILSGSKLQFSLAKFMKDLIRGIQLGLVNVFYQCLWILLLYVTAFFIPFLIPFLPIALFVVGAYYYGFAMIDYRNEVYGLSPKESRATVKQVKWFALGNGTAFQFLLMIPFIGTLLAPSFALVAAALGMEEMRVDTDRNDCTRILHD